VTLPGLPPATPLLQTLEPIVYPLHDRISASSIVRVSLKRFGVQLILLKA
jgi:hypothetical protein